MLKALSAKPELSEVRTFYDYGCVAVRLARMTTLYPRQEDGEAPSVVQGFWKFKSISDWLGAQVTLHDPQGSHGIGMRDPIALIRCAKLWAARAAHNHNDQLLDSALCILGCAGHLLSTRSVCSNCFRIADSDSLNCCKHSQAKAALRQQTKSELRIAKRIMDDHGKEWMHQGLQSAHPIELLLAILWPGAVVFGRTEAWQGIVGGVLHWARHVRSKLPHTFARMSFPKQLESLREVIDPNDWRVSDWPLKIAVAELWFAREEEATPRRGMSEKNRARCEQALALLAAGVSQADAAARLRMNEDRLSQLLRKYREDQPTERREISHQARTPRMTVDFHRELLVWRRQSEHSKMR